MCNIQVKLKIQMKNLGKKILLYSKNTKVNTEYDPFPNNIYNSNVCFNVADGILIALHSVLLGGLWLSPCRSIMSNLIFIYNNNNNNTS